MARKKDPNREYDKNGRVKPLEGPTPETAMKHQERAQRYRIPAHMEAGYAESTMGILYARGMISVEQYELCKKLANLRSVLYGSGNARCSSVENVGRGLPNDRETKSMRETWTAYKTATRGIEPADRRLFEMVVLRNSYREWMRMPDAALFHRVEADRLTHPGISVSQAVLAVISDPDNDFRDVNGRVAVKALRREPRILLTVIKTLHDRWPNELKDAVATLRNGEIRTGLSPELSPSLTPQHTGAISDGMANALYGGETLLDELYMAKAKRADQ